MLLVKRKCKCEGAVENCSFCFGSGEIFPQDDFTVRRAAHKSKSEVDFSPLVERFGSGAAKEKFKAIADRMEICDRCTFHGSSEALKAHKAEKHPSPEVLKAQKLEQQRHLREGAEARRAQQQRLKWQGERLAWEQQAMQRGKLEHKWQVLVTKRAELIKDLIDSAMVNLPVPVKPKLRGAMARTPVHPTSPKRQMTLREAWIAKGVQVVEPCPNIPASPAWLPHPIHHADIKCPFCSKMISAKAGKVKLRKALKKHLSSKHPLLQPQSPSSPSKASGLRGVEAQDSDAPDGQKIVWQPIDKMDANRGMAHLQGIMDALVPMHCMTALMMKECRRHRTPSWREFSVAAPIQQQKS